MSSEPAIPVEIEEAGGAGAGEARGLAEMLQQLLEQTLATSDRKRRLATRMRGRAVFQAAEDEALRIALCFHGDRIVVRDGAEPGEGASITADFLSMAHLAAGQANPFGLLVRRRVQAHFRPRDVPFLLQLSSLIRSESKWAGTRRRRWLTVTGAALVLAGVLIWALH